MRTFASALIAASACASQLFLADTIVTADNASFDVSVSISSKNQESLLNVKAAA
jgi:hypothetical protein